MKKLPPNAPCPCGSGLKYKKCCRPCHRGGRAPDALSLMRSRYSAYAAGEADYIIRTTHPENPDYRTETASWKEEILDFCRSTEFSGLEILEFIDGEEEAFVHFVAKLGEEKMEEKSRFLRNTEWLYHSGEFPEK